jgi:hypothetical protein
VDRRKLVVGAAVAILALGVGGVAIATQQGQEDENIKGGSIAAPAGSGEDNEGAENEGAENEAESRNVEGLAKIDRIQGS